MPHGIRCRHKWVHRSRSLLEAACGCLFSFFIFLFLSCFLCALVLCLSAGDHSDVASSVGSVLIYTVAIVSRSKKKREWILIRYDPVSIPPLNLLRRMRFITAGLIATSQSGYYRIERDRQAMFHIFPFLA